MIKVKCPKGRRIEQSTASSSKFEGQSRLSTETCFDAQNQSQIIDPSFEDYLRIKYENHQKQPVKEERKLSPRKIIESDLELKYFGLNTQRETFILPLMHEENQKISDSQAPLRGFIKRNFSVISKKALGDRSPLTKRLKLKDEQQPLMIVGRAKSREDKIDLIPENDDTKKKKEMKLWIGLKKQHGQYWRYSQRNSVTQKRENVSQESQRRRMKTQEESEDGSLLNNDFISTAAFNIEDQSKEEEERSTETKTLLFSSKNVSPYLLTERSQTSNDKEKNFPEWLLNQRDFNAEYQNHVQMQATKVIRICSKAQYRTTDELKIVAKWLKNVEFFKPFPDSLHRVIAEKLHYQHYNKGDYLCRIGDPGECLYIIYNGIVKCCLNGTEVARYQTYDTPGQAAITGAPTRTASLIAMTSTHVLRLEVEDFNVIMRGYADQEKEEVAQFLESIPIFKDLDVFQIRYLANCVQTKQYIKGEFVYHEGDSAESFYILKNGLLEVQTALILEKRNMWPLPDHLWMSSKLQRKMKYDGLVKPYDYFGETELIKNCKRHNTVVCLEHSQLFILNKSDFFKCLSSKTIFGLLSITRDNFGDNPDAMRLKLANLENQMKRTKDLITKNWGPQLRNLSPKELEKRVTKVVQPMNQKVENEFQGFLKNRILKTLKVQVVQNSNFN